MKINILLPVYNDWDSLNILLNDIKKIKDNEKITISSIAITIVNDCSTLVPVINENLKDLNIKILGLSNNSGSQKAINIGLRYLEKKSNEFDFYIIMDSDGEDKAEDILNLLNIAKNNKKKIIFASRGKRQDGLLFYLLYRTYLFFFYILTGKKISFGNFSCIPKDLLYSVTKLDYSKIHHSASILKSNLAIEKIKCDRGKRFLGKSKMSLKGLVFHGLNGMAIFFKIILKRFIIAFFLFLPISIFLIFFDWISKDKIYIFCIFLISLIVCFLYILKSFNKKIDDSNNEEINIKDIIATDEKI